MEYKIKKSRFWTFVLSLIPGGGHMYLGLLKQGLELMCMFFGIVALSSLLDLGPLGVLCPILVFYSIFDALSKRESDFDDKDSHCDIVNWIITKNSLPHIGSKFVGIALVVIGALFIISNFLPSILSTLGIVNSHAIIHFIKMGITAILLIGGGLYIAFRKPNPIYIEGESDHDNQ